VGGRAASGFARRLLSSVTPLPLHGLAVTNSRRLRAHEGYPGYGRCLVASANEHEAQLSTACSAVLA
jgi:hypothetical protein